LRYTVNQKAEDEVILMGMKTLSEQLTFEKKYQKETKSIRRERIQLGQGVTEYVHQLGAIVGE